MRREPAVLTAPSPGRQIPAAANREPGEESDSTTPEATPAAEPAAPPPVNTWSVLAPGQTRLRSV